MDPARVILLVEDNPDDQELTRMALSQCNIINEVVVVEDGAEALDYLFCTGAYAEHQDRPTPALVLLDLKLPKIDGIEVLRQLRIDPRTSLLPVVVLTSSREEQDILRTYELRANSYIRKPVDFEQFTNAVSQMGMYWLLLNEHPYLR